jgi:8-oxo-dGTP pyrophosphatase MutT (NUDIX family)
VGAAAWHRLNAADLRFTVDDVRRLCRHLPRPGHRVLHEVDQPRLAATAVPVVEVEGEAAVVLTKRPATMTYHRGDWVFPGGRVDAGDRSSAAAARREVAEELGVPRRLIDVVGQLDTHGPIVTGFLIDVFVAVLDRGAELAPDPAEVGEVAIVELGHFFGDGVYALDRPWPAYDTGPSAPGAVAPAPGASSGRRPAGELASFSLPNGELAWGTQGEILANLLDQLARQRARGRG